MNPTQQWRLLDALSQGPKTNAELCDVINEIGVLLARTMAKLIKDGLAVNRMRGRAKALYAITPAGRAVLDAFTSQAVRARLAALEQAVRTTAARHRAEARFAAQAGRHVDAGILDSYAMQLESLLK